MDTIEKPRKEPKDIEDSKQEPAETEPILPKKERMWIKWEPEPKRYRNRIVKSQKKKPKRKPKENPKRNSKEKPKEEIPWFFTKIENKPYTIYRRNKYNQLIPEPLL